MAALAWSDDGLSTTDGKYVVGVLYGLDGQQPIGFYWEQCPLRDERPHHCDTLDEIHEQAEAMAKGKAALGRYEAPRTAARTAAVAARRQTAQDAHVDSLVQKVLDRIGRGD